MQNVFVKNILFIIQLSEWFYSPKENALHGCPRSKLLEEEYTIYVGPVSPTEEMLNDPKYRVNMEGNFISLTNIKIRI